MASSPILLPVIEAAPKEVIASAPAGIPPYSEIALVLALAVIFALVYWRMSKHLKRSAQEIQAMRKAEQDRLAAQAEAAQIADPDVARSVFMQMNTAYYVALLQAMTNALRDHGFRLTKQPDKAKAIWYCSLPYTVHTHIAKRVALEKVVYLYPSEPNPEDQAKRWLDDGWAHKFTGEMLTALRTLGFFLEQSTEPPTTGQAIEYTAEQLAILDAEDSSPVSRAASAFSVLDELRSH